MKAPDTSLGLLISQNQEAFATRPWLFWFPGLFIVLICLSINFIGDGLRDAFDPRQKKFNAKKAKDTAVAQAAPVTALRQRAPMMPGHRRRQRSRRAAATRRAGAPGRAYRTATLQ